MVNRPIAILAIFFAVFTAPGLRAQPAGQKLTGEEIRAALFGQVWDVKMSEGGNFRFVINADGTGTREGVDVNQREGVDVNGARISQTGRFSVFRDQLCRYFFIRHTLSHHPGTERCFEIYRHGDKFLEVINGTVFAVMAKAESGPNQSLGVRLIGTEIQAALFGNTWRVSYSDGSSANVTIAKNGRATRVGVDDSGKPASSSGHFKIVGDRLCYGDGTTWNDCTDIYRQGDKIVQAVDGTILAIMARSQ